MPRAWPTASRSSTRTRRSTCAAARSPRSVAARASHDRCSTLGPRLPVARAQHADAVAGRAAAPAARHADPLATCSASSTCSTSRRPACIPPTPRRCSRALDRLKASGNSLFVVEHDLDVMRHADWIVDVGPGAGRARRRGALQRTARRAARRSRHRTRARYLFARRAPRRARRRARRRGWLAPQRRHAQQPARARRRVSARRVHDGHRRVGLGQVEPREPGAGGAGRRAPGPRARGRRGRRRGRSRASGASDRGGRIAGGHGARSGGWCTSTRSRSAARRAPTWPPTPGCSITCASCSPRRKAARARRYDAGRFSFNVAKGRCETCEGEGFVSVELLFMPSVYAPCPTCHGARYNAQTLEVTLARQEHRRSAAA